MGNSGLDGAISPTGMAFLEGEGAISPDTAKKPTPYSLGWARGFLSLLPLDASVHQKPLLLKDVSQLAHW